MWTPGRPTTATVVVVAASALSVACWVILYPWYSLADHYSTQYFAFDKIPDHFNSLILRATTILFLIASACYGVIYSTLQEVQQVTRPIKVVITVAVVATIAINVLLYPVGALDAYNYILELKLAFFYHQNPYLTTFATYVTDPASRFGFFNYVPLFYGPLWLYLSGLATFVTGFDDTQHVLLGLKLENLVFLAVTTLAVYRYQADARRGWTAAFLFVGNPLIVFETVGNAHNDMLMTAFLIFAVVALKRGSWLAAPLLTLSVLIKFFSAALLPLFFLDMFRRRWSKRRIAASCLLALGFSSVITLPLWAEGQLVTGLTQGMAVAQGLNSASLFSVVREYLRLDGVTPEFESVVQVGFIALFVVSMLVVILAVWRGRRVEAGLIDTFLLFAVLVSLLTPWYLLPALALIALAGDRAQIAYLLVATILGLLYYSLSVWAWFDSGMSPFQVHLFQALILTVPILGLFLAKLVHPISDRLRLERTLRGVVTSGGRG